MLESVKISRRQSEIRQELAALAGHETLTDEQRARMDELDRAYQDNERRYRAALIAEEEERRAAGEELSGKEDRDWAGLIDRFEVRQVALALDEGRTLNGATAEVVSELRDKGGFRGVPVPWEALERRTGETVSTATPDPITTRPIIDRLFPDSVASRMGGQMVSVGTGEIEWPVTTSSVTTGWQSSETGDVGAPAAFTTTDRPMKPDHTLGVQMKVTRRALKQSGAALEQAVRRDMNGAIQEAMDRAVFLGTGSSGEPTGLLPGASGYGINEEDVSATVSWAAIREAVTRFMLANAANGPGAVRLLCRPEVWSVTDGDYISGTAVTEWARITGQLGTVAMTSNALDAPSGSPLVTRALLTTSAGGVPPFYVGTWGAVDVIRDPYSDAASGGLRLTALATMDVTISRAAQLDILNNLQLA